MFGGASRTRLCKAQENHLQELQQAVRERPDDAKLKADLGYAFLSAARYDEAATLFTQLAQNDRSIGAAYRIAHVYLAKGDIIRATRACNAVKRRDRRHVLSSICEARILLIRRRLSRVIELLTPRLESDGEYPALVETLGEAHVLNGQKEEGERMLIRATQISLPNSSTAFLKLARFYRTEGRNNDAINILRQALFRNDDAPRVQFELARTLEPGVEALSLIERACVGRPRAAEFWTLRGEIELQLGDAIKAEPSFREAIRLQSGGIPQQRGLAETLVLQAKWTEAETAVRRVLRQMPNDYAAALILGKIEVGLGRNGDAIEQFRAAADLDARKAEPLALAAQTALLDNLDTIAVSFLDRALRREPQHVLSLTLYGDVMAKRRNLQEARRFYVQALTLASPSMKPSIQRQLDLLPE